MKTGMDIVGVDVIALFPDSKTASAIEGLEWWESHYIQQNVREAVPQLLADELQRWINNELHKSNPDVIKIGRMQDAHGKLLTVSSAHQLQHDQRLQSVVDGLNSGALNLNQ